ncbi:MAG: 6-phosphogluconolactonase [Woeseia sp.]
MISEFFFASRGEASAAAASRLHDALASALSQQDKASIVLSGGSTPADTFKRLSQMPLAWDRVTVTLSDERWVPADHEDSNTRMLRNTLLTHQAQHAATLNLFRDGVDVAAALPQLEADFCALPLPFASVLLGMGEDGHFASLFPDFAGLRDALNLQSDAAFVPVSTAASPHPRISMTLSALLKSHEVILLIFGAAKRRVYEDAKAGVNTLPIATLLAQTHVPLRVIWAP